MSPRNHDREDQLRRAVAQEAARIMVEHGVQDFLLAKRKAAERLMVSNSLALPKNAEIEAALLEHQRLFQSDDHAQTLRAQRSTALRMMELLAGFTPRLVGPVLSGSATAASEISLHAFAARAEQVSLYLEERGIRHEHGERKFRYKPERLIGYPAFKFVAGGSAMEIVVFPIDGIRQSPGSPVDGKPMSRASVEEVRNLLGPLP